MSASAWSPRGDDGLLLEYLPNDTSAQSHSFREATRLLSALNPHPEIIFVDLGCGSGSSYEEFHRRHLNLRWIGFDIPDSPEAQARVRTDLDYRTFNGLEIPLPNNSVDIVYSRQVFEHVRYPEKLLSEVHRVLAPNGFLVGSTSHLEAFHSRSLWNFTPYGFSQLLESAGFTDIVLRPGIDGATLLLRRFLAYARMSSICEPFFKVESPLNLLFELSLRLLGIPAQRRNCIKLLFSGHFCFTACK